MKRIVLVGDSYGCERIHNGLVDVTKEQTWPEQIKSALSSKANVEIDFLFRRKLVDCPLVIKKYLPADLVIVHAGVVDCFPRPLSERMTQSQQFFIKVFRKLTQRFRRQFITYIYNKPWSTNEQMWYALEQIHQLVKEKNGVLALITIVPINSQLEYIAPGAQQAIADFNALLRKFANKHEGAFIIDAASEAILKGSDFFIHPIDCHLNKAGNNMLAKLIAEKLNDLG